MSDISKLSNEAAVKALSIVSRRWLDNRGVEAYIIIKESERLAESSYLSVPLWAKEEAFASDESGEFARKMLEVLNDSQDDEVGAWTSEALNEVTTTAAHVIDPLTLAISGVILIGAILAARVKRIGSVEFYEGIPKELADVLKAGSSVIVP